jgi:hypothetical protein
MHCFALQMTLFRAKDMLFCVQKIFGGVVKSMPVSYIDN